MRKIILLPTFILISLIIFYSCSASDPYPQSWGKILNMQKYGDTIISGNYLNQGNKSGNNAREYSIFSFIDFPYIPKPEIQNSQYSNCDNFIINMIGKEKLMMILRSETDTLYKTVFPDNGLDLSLNDEGPELEGGAMMGGDWGLFLPIINSGTSTFMKSKDGSLIVRSSTYLWGIGMLFIIPIPSYSSRTTWIKFPKYEIK